MRVKALHMGIYNNKRVREGAVIELQPIKGKRQLADGKLEDHVFSPEEQFSSFWMEKVDAAAEAEVFTSKLPKKPRSRSETLDVI